MSVENLSIVITRPGVPEVLQPLTCTLPGPGEVRLRVLAAGVSYGDVMMRRGNVPSSRQLPYAPGYDVVGKVGALGAGVSGAKVGARVAVIKAVNEMFREERRSSVPRTPCGWGQAGQVLARCCSRGS